MPEYIEKEKLKGALCPYSDTNYAQDMETILRIVDEFPAADVAPVVHGRWLYSEKFGGLITHNCSLCGQTMTIGIESDLKNFCPNCGAKMDL